MSYRANIYGGGVSVEVTQGDGTCLHFTYSNAGRAKSFVQRNDCSVRALAIMAGISYRKSFNTLKKAGRKPHKIVTWKQADKAYSKHALKLWVPSRFSTVAEFVRTFRKGRYIVGIKGHVFPLIDGVIFDVSITNPQEKVLHAWTVL